MRWESCGGLWLRRVGKLANRFSIRRLVYYAHRARAFALILFARLQSSSVRSKVIVLDPALIDSSGHHAEFAHILTAGLAPRYSVALYSNFSIGTRLAIGLRAQPIFHESFYGMDWTQEFPWGKELAKVNFDDLSPSTIVVVHTATVPQLGGLCRWFAALPDERRPKLFLQFQHSLEFEIDDETNWPHAISLARQAVGLMAAIGTVRLAAISRSLAKHISQHLDQPCVVMPHPVRWPNTKQHPPAPVAEFGFFGGLRREKGATIIAAAVPRFLAAHPDARFIIQAATGDEREDAVRILQTLPQVELIHSVFPDKTAYFKHFLGAGCCLLPYDPAAYAVRTSGVLFEAMGLGRMIITTRGSWMEAELINRGRRALLMQRFHPDDLVQCLEQARAQLLERSEVPSFDASVIAECSAASFCGALAELMRS
jgi:glycosyltransferase involved in cell wall biosynthesis